MVTYIVVSRNPANGKLMVLSNDDNDAMNITEFKTEDLAFDAAKENMACNAWGAEIVPIGGIDGAGP